MEDGKNHEMPVHLFHNMNFSIFKRENSRFSPMTKKSASRAALVNQGPIHPEVARLTLPP